MLYQNDGVYGNLMNVLTEKEIIVPSMAMLGNGRRGGSESKSIRFGDRHVIPRIASIESVIWVRDRGWGFPGL